MSSDSDSLSEDLNASMMESMMQIDSKESPEEKMVGGVYATVCIDYKGKEVVELISTLVTLQRVDPFATVHILINEECKFMLERSPIKFNIAIHYDTSIDKYLRLNDKEMNEQGLVIPYYSSFFDFMKSVFDIYENDEFYFPRGVLYFSPGCLFMRTLILDEMEEYAHLEFVGVESTCNQKLENNNFHNQQTFIGDMFFVRSKFFLEIWHYHILEKADALYKSSVDELIVTKRKEYVDLKRKELKEEQEKQMQEEKAKETQDSEEQVKQTEEEEKQTEEQEKQTEEQEKQTEEQEKQTEEEEKQTEEQVKQTEEQAQQTEEQAQQTEEEVEIEIPDDFDEQISKAYHMYVFVDRLRRKFDYVYDVGREAYENEDENQREITGYFSDETYINSILFFRMENKLEFLELQSHPKDSSVVLYKKKPVYVMKKLTGVNGGDHLNAPIHKIVSLFSNANRMNPHLLMLSSGAKVVFNRNYDDNFGNYKHDPYFYNELYELMEARNRGYVTSKYLLYPCNSVNSMIQTYEKDDESDILLPYLSGKMHTMVHFELSEEMKEKFGEFNPNGWSKHLKCPERPILLHKLIDEVCKNDEYHTEGHEERTEGSPKQTEGREGDETLDGDEQAQEQAKRIKEKEKEKDLRSVFDKHIDQMTTIVDKERNVVLYDPERSQRFGSDDEKYEEYVRKLLDARFVVVYPDANGRGISHQLTEAMACGCIPVLASDENGASLVDVDGFEYPLEAGLHYLTNELQIARLGIGMECDMRSNCVAYYESYCSPEGYMQVLMHKYFDASPWIESEVEMTDDVLDGVVDDAVKQHAEGEA